MKYRYRYPMRVLDVEGRGAFIILDAVDGEADVFVAIPTSRARAKRDVDAVAWALWPDKGPAFRVDLIPAGMTPGPWLAAALDRPLTLDEAVPTSPEFLDWWRRICAGEIQRGVLAGEGEGGDPLEHQADEDRKRPRRTLTDSWARYEVDGKEYVRVETGASRGAAA